jgi:uncharacterized repeat protein (TIGR03943 family)
VKRETQAVLLVLVGGTLLKISVAGTYVRYVRVGLRPYLIAAGVVMLAVAAATLWQVLVRRPSEEDDHGHAHGRWDVAWLLLLPVVGLLLIAPPALGSFAAARSGTALPAANKSRFPPLPDGDPVRISVLDYASRAVYDHGHSLQGRQVLLSGFVLAGSGGQRYLVRMVITCCAADASPVKVALAGDVPADLAAGGWIEVLGRYNDQTVADTVNDEKIPYLTVQTTRVIPAPKQQYDS